MLAGAQSTTYTTPSGYTSSTIPAGNNPFAPGLTHDDTHSATMIGIVESGTDTTISFAPSSFTAAEFDAGTLYPLYYLEITDPGAAGNQGYVFDVLSNTDFKIVVPVRLGTDFGLSGTEQITVRKHMTVGDLFESATGLAAFSDSVKFFHDDNTTTSLFWDGTNWTPDFATDHSTFPIYPGSGFLTVFGGEVNVTVFGAVKTTPTKVPVYGGAINFVSGLTPVDTTVGDLNLVPSLAPFSENIKMFNQDGTLSELASYFTDGLVMTKDFATDHGADPVSNSDSFLLNVGSDKYWTVPAAYIP